MQRTLFAYLMQKKEINNLAMNERNTISKWKYENEKLH